MKFPATASERRAGMAAFRARMLAAHRRALAAATKAGDAEQAAQQRDLIGIIESRLSASKETQNADGNDRPE
jgi:hypothetical protein